jgi:hypothetical protein
VAGTASQLGVFLNQGDGGFSLTQYLTFAYAVALVPNPGGAPDLVATAPDLEFLKNRGDGTFVVEDLEQSGVWVKVGDFNGDCIPDIATTWSPECSDRPTIAILYGQGDGGFGTAVSLQPTGTGPASLALLGPVASPRALAVGDWCQPGLAIYGNASEQ